MAAVSPIEFSSSPTPDNLSARLEADISRVRQQIASFQAQKDELRASLLSSTKLQNYINSQKSQISTNNSPIAQLAKQAEQQDQHNNINRYRLAFGVTAFPFTDPNPESAGEPDLLGVRFDLIGRKGTFDKPSYYVVLKRRTTIITRPANDNRNREPQKTWLGVHHTTLPTHIDVDGHAEHHLPLPAEFDDDRNDHLTDVAQSSGPDSDNDSGIDVTQDMTADMNHTASVSNASNVTTASNGQDLHAFVAAVRDDLVAWHYRTEAIAHVIEQLSAPNEATKLKYALHEIVQTTADARQLKVVWSNGTLGLLKIGRDGIIERATVLGPSESGDGGTQRMHGVQRTLTTKNGSEKVHLADLVSQLERCQQTMSI